LQVCSDNEDGTLWFSERDYKQWLNHAHKYQLDPNIDTWLYKRRMERLWLRPLSRVPKKQYLKLAKKTAARLIEVPPRGEDVCWTEVEYGNVMQHVKKWMEGIHKQNAVFLLPARIFFDESMRTRFGLAAECTLLRGVWIFEATTVAASRQDLKNGGQVEQSMQAIGGVVIVMEHPTGSRAVENIVRTPGGQLPLAFTDSWNEDRMPRAADTLERSPTELQRMVRAYLPPSWCLMAVGITTSVVDIVQDGFQGSQVIVVD
jgi:hypothetical protein